MTPDDSQIGDAPGEQGTERQTSTETETLWQRFLSWVPGTTANARSRVARLFDESNFDADSLTESERKVLEASVEQKYVPALRTGVRSQIVGLLIGILAPVDFLLIGAVTLAASAASTTGAWYSITLKEMKAKFEQMGLNLTSNLLKSDVIANALSIYAGIGLAYRTIAWPAIVAAVADPTGVSLTIALVNLGVSIVIHVKLEEILRSKTEASIQFDFNDATLAGMTEEQQRFFAKAVSEVHAVLTDLPTKESGINLNRSIIRCAQFLNELIKKFDVTGRHHDSFRVIDATLTAQQHNYEVSLSSSAALFADVTRQLIALLDLDEDASRMLVAKVDILRAMVTQGGDEHQMSAKVVAIIMDVMPLVLKFMETRGEKGIRQKSPLEPPAEAT